MIEYTYVDANQDGYRETGMADTDLDGRVESYSYDTNRDGYSEVLGTDLDLDGRVDRFDFDTDLDGQVDASAPNTLPAPAPAPAPVPGPGVAVIGGGGTHPLLTETLMNDPVGREGVKEILDIENDMIRTILGSDHDHDH